MYLTQEYITSASCQFEYTSAIFGYSAPVQVSSQKHLNVLLHFKKITISASEVLISGSKRKSTALMSKTCRTTRQSIAEARSMSLCSGKTFHEMNQYRDIFRSIALSLSSSSGSLLSTGRVPAKLHLCSTTGDLCLEVKCSYFV